MSSNQDKVEETTYVIFEKSKAESEVKLAIESKAESKAESEVKLATEFNEAAPSYEVQALSDDEIQKVQKMVVGCGATEEQSKKFENFFQANAFCYKGYPIDKALEIKSAGVYLEAPSYVVYPLSNEQVQKVQEKVVGCGATEEQSKKFENYFQANAFCYKRLPVEKALAIESERAYLEIKKAYVKLEAYAEPKEAYSEVGKNEALSNDVSLKNKTLSGELLKDHEAI